MKKLKAYQVKAPHITSASTVLEEIMQYHHWSIKKLATKLDLSKYYLKDILARKNYVNRAVANKIQRRLGISAKLLLNLDKDYRKHN